MQFMLQPYHILLAALIGWANERQQQIIEFQNDQIKALLKKLGKKRVLLTDDQRRVLAVKGHALGRKALLELTTIVTPDTILRWHRELVANEVGPPEGARSFTAEFAVLRRGTDRSIRRFASFLSGCQWMDGALRG